MTARHTMILASAGAGKTYALTNRFVQLLADGARPERIVALTFTRKAAGEFFDEILNKLARAAREESYARQLARDLARPALAPADFRRMLRATVDAMPRLRLGTLDGFYARIVRAFPLELGLAGEFEVLHEHAARTARQGVLRRMFAGSAGGPDAAQREFIEAFKRATFGTEEKRLGARLDAFLDGHQETFLAAPDADRWGNPARIWPAGCAWLDHGGVTLAQAAAALRAALALGDRPEKQRARWEAFFAALPEWAPGAPLPAAAEYVLKNALDVWPDVLRGGAEMTVERKKFALGAGACAALAATVRHIVGGELARRAETTRGIHAVLRGYEAHYDDAVRRGGRLTFGDVLRLLLPEAGAARLTGRAAGEGRMLIDYRLDAQFDHWLLDEFQDTSFAQWSVLENLIDEAVQDPEGARSFFCVGDVKQAIFTWREGDPRLFREILGRYNDAAPGTIAEEHLVASWRSGPPVIDMVNAVCGAGAALADLFPGPASAAWNREWRAHASAVPQRGGQAAWLHAEDEAERFALTVRLLHEIAPLERGLECAVLTQTNAAAAALADYLRQEGGIPAVAESDLHVCTDNPLGAALLALVQAAAFPGDTLAQEHLKMTPLGAVLAREGAAAPAALTARVLGQIHAGGFERTLAYWLERLEGELAPDDAFSRVRGRQAVAAAALFDATGSRDAGEFVAFMERHVVRGVETAGVVRVMTIHKSKGLGFDVVILPDLEGQRIDQRRAGLAVQRARDRTVEWVFDLPPKLFYAQDESLSAHVREAEAAAGYEAFSLLYVALTRAKRAMYAITKPPGNSASRNYPKWIAAALGEESTEVRVGAQTFAGGWSAGDADWFEAIVPPPVSVEAEGEAERAVPETARVPRRVSRRPSAERGGAVDAAQCFAPDGGQAAEFGTAVHALLADVEWGSDERAEARARRWRERGADEAAMAEALACLHAPELAEVWRRPEHGDVWRERSFECVLENEWVTGVFDRVVVRRDAAGRALGATVYDFKTDALPDSSAAEGAAARHAAQLALYRRIAAVLADVPPETVRGFAVFTRVRRAVAI